MNREEQIQEMYEQIKYSTGSYDSDARDCADILYDYMGYHKASDVAKEIFEKLYANIKFDGHTVGVWKNDLIEAAKEYGISLE